MDSSRLTTSARARHTSDEHASDNQRVRDDERRMRCAIVRSRAACLSWNALPPVGTHERSVRNRSRTRCAPTMERSPPGGAFTHLVRLRSNMRMHAAALRRRAAGGGSSTGPRVRYSKWDRTSRAIHVIFHHTRGRHASRPRTTRLAVRHIQHCAGDTPRHIHGRHASSQPRATRLAVITAPLLSRLAPRLRVAVAHVRVHHVLLHA